MDLCYHPPAKEGIAAIRVLFTNQASQSAGVTTSSRRAKEVRDLRGLVSRRLWFGALCWHRGAVLATLALLALGGRHLGGHMSQWHHAHGRWGQGRGFSGRSSAKRKGGNHIPER
ncbi:hypothetical protein E2I00_011777 [Balaenoptera physalus]|uniref:Uncharacterized protein n=1 Tax=Balaenoptera physalus TaxID=9770 RepID=A0A643AUM8_BALPH|nr:hypothetical protein E2I00_011777 [Balaenoptera physalus]